MTGSTHTRTTNNRMAHQYACPRKTLRLYSQSATLSDRPIRNGGDTPNVPGGPKLDYLLSFFPLFVAALVLLLLFFISPACHSNFFFSSSENLLECSTHTRLGSEVFADYVSFGRHLKCVSCYCFFVQIACARLCCFFPWPKNERTGTLG